MSRASAAVLFPDGTIKYAIYNGTSDVLWRRLFDTIDEAWEAYQVTKQADDPGYRLWYSTFFPAEDLPQDSGEPVQIYEDYGGGSEWSGFATREYITSENDPYEIEDRVDYDLDTNPEWLVWR